MALHALHLCSGYGGFESYEMVSNDKRDAFSLARAIQDAVNGTDQSLPTEPTT